MSNYFQKIYNEERKAFSFVFHYLEKKVSVLIGLFGYNSENIHHTIS